MNNTAPAYWLLVQDFNIYLPNNQIPFGTAEQCGFSQREAIAIGELNHSPVYLVQANECDADKEFVFLRTQIARPETEAHLLHRAVSLNHFFTHHQFCGKCVSPTVHAENEIAMHCDHCGTRVYPTISPSIIVAVRRGKQILLANHLRHKGTIYTTLAGFVEAGEPIEHAVHREVFEETQLKIKNVRYFGSQPWAFPNSLMIGFLADYESGEIGLQEEEIYDAKWFHCDEPLPELPPEGTIALALIRETLAQCRAE